MSDECQCPRCQSDDDLSPHLVEALDQIKTLALDSIPIARKIAERSDNALRRVHPHDLRIIALMTEDMLRNLRG